MSEVLKLTFVPEEIIVQFEKTGESEVQKKLKDGQYSANHAVFAWRWLMMKKKKHQLTDADPVRWGASRLCRWWIEYRKTTRTGNTEAFSDDSGS